MSWLARSIATSLRLDDQDNDVHDENDDARTASTLRQSPSPIKRNGEVTETETGICEKEDQEEEREEELQARGVKEDLTELKQTLTKQLWGVASFLAPPSESSAVNSNQSEPSDRSCHGEESEPSDSEEMSGVGQDFAEIGGRFREISKMASNYFPFGSEENEGKESEFEEEEEEEEELDWGATAIGITDEVLAFARNIAMHPETWLDFPLDEEDDLDDFNMSNAQREHAFAVEQLAPRLAALRIELCPCHMTESYFWKVYFVLLHSRLNKHDAEILSTPQVMEARAMWMQELHKQTKPDSDWLGGTTSYVKDSHIELHEDFGYARTFDYEWSTSTTTAYETDRHPVVSTEMQFVDKSVIEEKPMIKTEDKDPVAGPSSKFQVPNYEDDEDDWPDEEDSDLGSYKGTIPVGNAEDISFSDLEDDASGNIPIMSKILPKNSETKAR